MKKIIYFLSILTLLIFIPLTIAQAGLGNAFNSSSPLTTAAKQGSYKIDGSNLASILSNILFITLTLLGTIFLIMIIYGGLTWMLAEGNEQRVEKAGETIKQAIIGLVIVIAAYAISYYLINIFGGQLKS